MTTKFWRPVAQPISYDRRVFLSCPREGKTLTLTVGTSGKIYTYTMSDGTAAEELAAMVVDIAAVDFPELKEAEITVDDDGRLAIIGPAGVQYSISTIGGSTVMPVTINSNDGVLYARVYEFDDAGTDSRGLGPTLTGQTYVAGKVIKTNGSVGKAISDTAAASVNTSPGFTLSSGGVLSNFYCGFWLYMSDNMYSGNVAKLTLDDGTARVIVIAATQGDGTIAFELSGNNLGNVIDSNDSIAVANGWSHYHFQVNGDNFLIYKDGSTTQSTEAAGAALLTCTSTSAISKIEALHSSLIDQLYFGPGIVDFTVSPAAATIYNSAAGLHNSYWTIFYSLLDTVAASGPNFIDLDANWSPSGYPTSSDVPIFQNTDVSAKYYSGTTYPDFTAAYIDASFVGDFGLPHTNENGYLEYRPTFLRLDALSLYIGRGEGPGSSLIKVDNQHATDAKKTYVYTCGTRNDSNVPSFLYKATGAGTGAVVEVFAGGDVGISGNDGDATTTNIGTVYITDGQFFGGPTSAVGGYVVQSGTFIYSGTAMSGSSISWGGEVRLTGSATSFGGTIQVYGSVLVLAGQTTAVTLTNVVLGPGGVVDLSQGLGTVTFTALTGMKNSKVIDPGHRASYSTITASQGGISFE